MKLRNKLIPLMSAAAVAATVAPIATSCGNNMSTVDLTKPYNPTIDRAKALEDVTTDQVADYYMNEIMNNPEILKQDILYYENQKLPARIALMQLMPADEFNLELKWEPGEGWVIKTESSTTNVVANLSMSDVQVNRVEALVAGKQTQFYTISMSLNYEFEIVLESLSTEPHYQNTYKQSFKSTYKDIPLSLYSSKADETWNLTIDLLDDSIEELLKYVPSWSFSFETARSLKKVVTINGLESEVYEQDSDAGTITRRSQILSYSDNLSGLDDTYINFVSYHLSDVEVPEDLVTLNWKLENAISLKAQIDSTTNKMIITDPENTKSFFSLTTDAEKLSNVDDVQIELKFIYDEYWNDYSSVCGYNADNVTFLMSNSLAYNATNKQLYFESGVVQTSETLSAAEFTLLQPLYYTITWRKSQQVLKTATYPVTTTDVTNWKITYTA